MAKPIQFFVLGALMTILGSCRDEAPDAIKKDYNYFPLVKGFYQIYDVTETQYTLSIPETFQYELKMVVVDSFSNNEGGYSYVIHRSRRDANEEWEPSETWSAKLYRNEAIVSEGNVPYVVLNFPTKEGASWNGNAYNDNVNPTTSTNDDIYEITKFEESMMLGDQNFSDCITVTQEDNGEFIVFNDKRIEVYSRNVGLISKEVTQLKYCTDSDCLGQQIIDEGVIYKQTLKEYGKE